MTFVKFEGELHGGYRARNKLQHKLEEFVTMNAKVVKVNFRENEYKNTRSLHTSLCGAVKRFCGPVKAIMSDGEVYLIRTDM